MAFTKPVWDQLKATTVEEFGAALERDGFTIDPASAGAVRVYIRKERSQNRRVVVHYHPQKSWGAKFLKGLISDAGWREDDLSRLGLIAAMSKKEAALATYLVPCDCDRGIVGDGQPCPLCGGTSFKEVPLPPTI